jgi:RNA polymerase sigma-70 factor (ECF subfamily)
MTDETDEQVAQRVQKGEPEMFGELVERYQDKLMRYARKFLLDPDDAQDIVQDIFVKSYENIQSFDVSRRFSPWVYRIAHNEFVNALKKRASRRTVFTFDIDTLLPNLTAEETADSATMERDMKRVLDTHLDALDAKYREPLILYYQEGMDYREISDILQIPVSTVGVRLARARAMLKKNAGGKPIYE